MRSQAFLLLTFGLHLYFASAQTCSLCPRQGEVFTNLDATIDNPVGFGKVTCSLLRRFGFIDDCQGRDNIPVTCGDAVEFQSLIPDDACSQAVEFLSEPCGCAFVGPPPTSRPTPLPTLASTPRPTFKPTPEPTSEPTPEPTPEPTSEPTSDPTFEPTVPQVTRSPTFQPTEVPLVNIIEDSSLDIVGIAEASKDLSSFASALNSNARLVNALTLPGNQFTVFAPLDSAFSALESGTLDDLLRPENARTLSDTLLYHIIPGLFTSSDLSDGAQLRTLQTEVISVTMGESILINESTIVTADVNASNGVIHVIDKVLIPFTYNPIVAPRPTPPPTPSPTAAPTVKSTEAPLLNIPEETSSPTSAPVDSPVSEPTDSPIPDPTEAPVPEPTAAPIAPPTPAPSLRGTTAPVETTDPPVITPAGDENDINAPAQLTGWARVLALFIALFDALGF